MIAEIGGADRTAYLKVNSCRFSGDLNGRWTLSAQLEGGRDGYPSTRPVRGSAIEINDGLSPLVIYFAGNISRIVERHHPGTTALQFDIEARDYNHIPNRRTVTAEYENQTLYAIVSHINTNFLNGEGISLAGVTNPGPTIAEKLTFRYESAASCFNRLSAITGYQWKIDFPKVLYFVEYTAAAPVAFTITDTSANWRDFEVEVSDEDYRNRQYERTEIAVAATAGSFSPTTPTESPITAFAGQTSFPTAGAVTEMRRITVDGVDKTFINVPNDGTAIPGSGYDFYCVVGNLGFFALDWGPAVGGEILTCDYLMGWSPYSDGGGGITSADPEAGVRVVMAEDTAAQTARAAIEGGSGIWAAIEEQRNISSAAALQAIAEGRLRQYAVDASHVRFTTDDGADLLPGQRIVINLSTLHGINTTYLIERIEQDWVRARLDFFRTRVTCTTAEPYGQASSFVEKLVETARIGPGDRGGGIGGMLIEERPIGIVDGVNTVFRLTYEPDPQIVWLSAAGLDMNPIDGDDYSLDGAVITYAAGRQPTAGEDHLARYFHGGVRRLSSARRFDTSSEIDYGYHSQFNITGDVAIGMWVRLPSNANGFLIAWGYPSGNEPHNMNYSLYLAGASNAWDIVYLHDYTPPTPNAWDTITFNSNIPNDVWRYLGISRNATAKTVALYVGDGASLTSYAGAYTHSPTGGGSTDNHLEVGGNLGSGVAGDLRGDVQEHYIWNRLLSQAEHELAMKGSPPASGLILSVPIVGNSPEEDISSTGASGTLTGTTVIAGH